MTQLDGPPLESVQDIGQLTVGGFLLEVCDRFGANDCLVFDDPLTGETVRWSYDDLRDASRRVAKALLATGVTRGTRVAVLMANRPEAVAAFFGTALVGGVVVPLSTFSPKAELGPLLTRADILVLLTQAAMGKRRFAEDIAELMPSLPALRHVVTVGEPADADARWDDWLAKGDTITDQQLEAASTAVTPDDPGLIIFSSGTTSQPKGMLHSHRAPTLQFWMQSKLFDRFPGTRMWTALPLFWTAGINTAMGSTLAAGGCWVMQEGFNAGKALELFERERVTEPYTLPHQAAALEEHPDWERTDLSSLTKVFGKSVFARHPSVTGDPKWNMPVGYGLSETCAFVVAHASNTPRELTKASTGRLMAGCHLRIVDPESGRLLGPNQEGEIALRGPTMMLHYLGRSPAECFDADGFFHTGDLGSYDDEGFVHYAGRRTEMIKTGGANVSPAELEVQLRAYEPARLARVIGVPDSRLDEIVVLCLELKEGYEVTEADVQSFLRERVAAYKVPKRVLFFDDGEIPMTSGDTKVRDEPLLALVTERL